MSLSSSKNIAAPSLPALNANFSSAGSRDSALTNHGYQQATRLGQHFKVLGLTFTHLFSSHLQRAAKTAGKIREAQSIPPTDDGPAKAVPDVVKLPGLMEQDFGSMEGKKFHHRLPESKTSGKHLNRQEDKGTEVFVEVESKDNMTHRADTFLDEHIMPLFGDASKDGEPVVAIVSHGIFLSTLWKRILLLLPFKSIVLSPQLQEMARPSLKHLGGWSNTGYLELYFERTEAKNEGTIPPVTPAPEFPQSPAEMPIADEGLGKVEVLESATKDTTQSSVSLPSNSTSHITQGWSTTILKINGQDHLHGLKRTGGGVGSSRHDTSQRSIDTFFKRRKVE